MPADVQIDDEGRAWCQHRASKRVYESLHAAWGQAFRIFVESGKILTPYMCGQSRNHIGVVRVRITQNPYATNPFLQSIGTHKRRTRGCGRWHLTSHMAHVLPSAR